MGLLGKKADKPAEVKEPKNAKKSENTKNSEAKVSIFEKNRKLAKAKSTMGEFRVRDYWYFIVAIIIFIVLKLGSSVVKSSAEQYCDSAKSSYESIQKSISYLKNGNQKRIEFVEVHDDAAMDPSERHKEDDAFIIEWTKPIFNFNGIEEYMNNREIMRKRFGDSYVPLADMDYFLQAVMPAQDDLKYDENSMNLNAKMKFTSYLSEIDEATDTYTYVALLEISSKSPINGTEGKSTITINGDKGANYCMVYKVAIKDGERVLRGMRFASIT